MGMNVSILGLGLMGGSLGLALAGWKEREKVKGYDPDPRVLSKAGQRKAVNDTAASPREAVEGADVVFLAAPLTAVPALIAEITPHLEKHAVVLDLSSTREWICARVSHLAEQIQLSGFHPMCGSSRGGIEEARADLFAGAPILATPLCEKDTIKNVIRHLSDALGGRVFFYPQLSTTGSVHW